MSESTPEPSALEAVARLAAEAVVEAMPDYAAALEALAAKHREDLDALAGTVRRIRENAAAELTALADSLAPRLTALEGADPAPALESLQEQIDALKDPAPAYPDPAPALESLQEQIDALKLAHIERLAG